ncbi:MAG TPA: hypothetical protein VJ183_02090 [Chloroflexia bacterium]|nr:hypothetical protein [Chloroflexia bacterium]
MTPKDYVSRTLESLSDAEIEQVAEYLAFLKFRARRLGKPTFDTEQMAALYGEFAEEDRLLAEEGMAEYYQGLLSEDTR